LFGVVLGLVASFGSISAYASALQTEKKSCMMAAGAMAETKKNPLLQAKREATNELFGELITSYSAVEDFELMKDSITSSSAGYVRIDGSPVYSNGQSLGEVCVAIKAYVTKEDLNKFKPVAISNKQCISDGNLTLNKIKRYTEKQVVVSALLNYSPKLKGKNSDELMKLAHNIKFSESGFIPDTATYCAQFTAKIYPVEIESLKSAQKKIIRQWAKSVTYFSSQYNSSGWSAQQVIGAPNIQKCGDIRGAWTTSGSGEQYVEVEYEQKVLPSQVVVRENYTVGFMTKLAFYAERGNEKIVDVRDNLKSCPGNSEFHIANMKLPATNRIRVYVNADHGGYEEIDAIELIGFAVN